MNRQRPRWLEVLFEVEFKWKINMWDSQADISDLFHTLSLFVETIAPKLTMPKTLNKHINQSLQTLLMMTFNKSNTDKPHLQQLFYSSLYKRGICINYWKNCSNIYLDLTLNVDFGRFRSRIDAKLWYGISKKSVNTKDTQYTMIIIPNVMTHCKKKVKWLLKSRQVL